MGHLLCLLCQCQVKTDFTEIVSFARNQQFCKAYCGHTFTLMLYLLCLQCYVFHLYVGVRAGGGIGDEIDSADGDASEVYRILFDITFFFFVIIILLAIIQGRIFYGIAHVL